MILNFIFVFFLINFGGAYGGTVTPSNCSSAGTAYLVGGTVTITPSSGSDDCSGTNRCNTVAGLDYTVTFSSCSLGLNGTNVDRIPLKIKGVIDAGLGLIQYSYKEINLCDTYTADSATQLCPVTLDACGTHQFVIHSPFFVLPLLQLPVQGDLIIKAWINVVEDEPVLCIKIPITYYVL